MTVTDARAEHRRPARGASALVGSAGLFLRRLRLDPGPPLALLALVGVTCFLFAALPRLTNTVADDGLRYMVERAPATTRNVRVLENDRLPAREGADPLAAVADRARRSQQELPAALRELVASSTYVVRSTRYILQEDMPSGVPATGAFAPGAGARGLIRYLNVRLQSGVRPHIALVAGRFPTPSTVRVPTQVQHVVFYGEQASPVSWTARVPLVQVALSTETAEMLRLEVGDRAVYMPHSSDVPVRRVPTRDAQPLAVEVVGLFRVKRPRDSFWFDDPTLGTPHVIRTADLETTQVFADALVSPSQYATALSATNPLPLAYEYRHFVDPDRLDAGGLPSLRDALARLESRYAGAGPLERRVEIALGPVLDRYDAARAQASTLLAVAAIGLFGCALANVGLLGVLWYDRRRRETGLSRTRGASPLNVLAVQAAEGLLVAAPAGLLGWAVAELAIPARGSSLSAWLVLGVVFATVGLLVAAIAGAARRPLGPLDRDDVVLTRLSPRRLVLEGSIAVAAALGVYLLRSRGLESSAEAGGGFDPYLAGVPVLLGLACGVVALRLYPLPIAGAARLARRTRGLALHLGLSRAARQPDISSAPLLVLVLALAIACFSSAMLSTLEEGQDNTAWRAIGGEVRIDAPVEGGLPASLVSRLDSIGGVTRAYVQDAGVGAAAQRTLLLALDLPAYERLVAGTSADVRFPVELRKPPIPVLVPALVSTDWPAPGTFQATLPHQSFTFLTIGDRASFPGIPRDTPFAVVPLGALEEAGSQAIPPNRLYVRGVSAAAVRRAVDETAPGARIGSRADVVRDLRASPLVENVFRGFRAAIVLAALYAAVAVALMALIAGRSRSRDLALVRTMGASPREAVVLAAVELLPLVATALALGIGLGIAIPYLIEPGLDLAFFTGTGSNAIVVTWLAPAVFAAGVLAFVTATVVVVGFRARRAGLDRVLRIGER